MDSYFPLTNVAAAAISFYALFGTIFFNRKSRSHHQENKPLASSSLTLLAPPSSLPHKCKHHVFPSFHGADVRKNFLSHIIKEFKSKGIDLFMDNNIERSKSISPKLIEAIRGSRIAIVFLSKNYASSTWCLNELVEIIKCREELDHIVISIFYKVDPTHVKKQTGDFGKVFRKSCKGKTKEKIRKWKHALTEVAQIAGYHSANWETETEMIEAITTDVSNKLNLSAPSTDFEGLVGMKYHMTKMRRLLQLDSDEAVRKIGIWGPPGIGKTTIARSLFNCYSQDFQMSIFMDNIKRKHVVMACSDDYSVKLDLQKKFMSQLTNEMDIKVPHLGVAKDRLKDKKVLVVLDDVDRSVQLEAMAKETSWFGPGSRIIITTQDEKVLKASGINHIHKVKLPSDDEALQMFCMYAFDQKYPKDGFQELAWKVRDLVGRLPLGLKVMGSYFRGMSEQDWTKAVPRLRTHLDRNREISSILKFSYDALHDEDKRLFLHIACFFNGELVDMVECCLENCFLDVTQGFHALVEKSLISIEEEEERIKMSKLLIQLGRKIVGEESISEPGKRQFLHDAIDISEVLSVDNAGVSNVIGIDLDENEDITYTSERAFEKLPNLQFLRIHGDGVNPQSMKYISQKLRVLSWNKFQMPCFPSSFNPKFLVKLEMPYSTLERLWKENKPLSNLKWMDLSFSKRLKELPNLLTATNLYDLNLTNCSSLAKLPLFIENAVSLELHLRYCSSLVKLPFSIGNVVNHQGYIDLTGCSSLLELPSSIGNSGYLRKLVLSYCSSLVVLPFSIGNAINLQELNLNHCSSLVELPSSMRNLDRLSKLELEKCSKLEVVLANINLESLEKLNLSDCYLLKSYPTSYTDILELDPWIMRESRLHTLVLSGMKKLVSLPQLPDSVVELYADNCESLKRLDCSFRNPGIRLNFKNCFKLSPDARDIIIQTRTNKYAVFPVREVPICFTYRSSGSSLTVKLNQKPLGKSTKFKACILFSSEDKKYFKYWGYIYCSITSRRNALIVYSLEVEGILSGHLLTFEVEVETEEVTSTELLFDFDIPQPARKTWVIKECGIFQLLEVPLLSFRDVNEDFEPSHVESSSSGDKAGSGHNPMKHWFWSAKSFEVHNITNPAMSRDVIEPSEELRRW